MGLLHFSWLELNLVLFQNLRIPQQPLLPQLSGTFFIICSMFTGHNTGVHCHFGSQNCEDITLTTAEGASAPQTATMRDPSIRADHKNQNPHWTFGNLKNLKSLTVRCDVGYYIWAHLKNETNKESIKLHIFSHPSWQNEMCAGPLWVLDNKKTLKQDYNFEIDFFFKWVM